ncbi:hypothetical protein COCVIDRAFT_109086 [Bipolaris victoriae FI3]|uniref:Uncharacterized protein n=1 Tax=Bipolaris victoriae (strain FI3) TaxID=930091 RepID=W7E845_BIPV3|nr:hypothetical protein COCVIDRAFT_109086 [Bipolaris victoriae FI3]
MHPGRIRTVNSDEGAVNTRKNASISMTTPRPVRRSSSVTGLLYHISASQRIPLRISYDTALKYVFVKNGES